MFSAAQVWGRIVEFLMDLEELGILRNGTTFECLYVY